MEKKKVSVKLSLFKKTVAVLSKEEENQILGGVNYPTVGGCISWLCSIKFTECPQQCVATSEGESCCTPCTA